MIRTEVIPYGEKNRGVVGRPPTPLHYKRNCVLIKKERKQGNGGWGGERTTGGDLGEGGRARKTSNRDSIPKGVGGKTDCKISFGEEKKKEKKKKKPFGGFLQGGVFFRKGGGGGGHEFCIGGKKSCRVGTLPGRKGGENSNNPLPWDLLRRLGKRG